MKVLVTGAGGFLGKNLSAVLDRSVDVELSSYDVRQHPDDFDRALRGVEIVFHLAGVNRPANIEDFERVNVGLTRALCDRLTALKQPTRIVLASSVQADTDTPYGRSKRGAEAAVRQYAADSGGSAVVYRLKNVFGKWCRPHYNSVVATFCHSIARHLPISFSDPANVVDLTYVDDVVGALVEEVKRPAKDRDDFSFAATLPSTPITLRELARLIYTFREARTTLHVPDMSSPFVRALYGTYLSYLEMGDFAYPLTVKSDDRGGLAEFVKSPTLGQIFLSRTKPGVTRGHHYHHSKTEKFLVLEGEAAIRFRHILSGEMVEYRVDGARLQVVDIPPGYTHSIENVGSGELLTLFWASEVFDPERPDTNPLQVQSENETP